MSLPSIFAYLDHRAFLRDWIDARKRADPEYSYAAFARAGGCTKGAVSNVVNGARAPRSATLDAFAKAMSLSPRERNYLGLLADLAGARDLEERRATMERILKVETYHQMRRTESENDSDLFRYLEHWYIPVIREMALLPGFQPDPTWIAQNLQPAISTEEAATALETLRDLGFLVEDEHGQLTPREIRFRSAQTSRQSAVAHFYRAALPTLLRGLDTDRADEQHLLAATVSLPASLMPELKKRLNLLQDQLIAMADDAPVDEDTRIYQFSVQLLPVTAPPDGP